jgi:hypothetical protein
MGALRFPIAVRGGLRVALSISAVSAPAPGWARLGPTSGQVFGWEPGENDPFAMVLQLPDRSLVSADRFDGFVGIDQDGPRHGASQGAKRISAPLRLRRGRWSQGLGPRCTSSGGADASKEIENKKGQVCSDHLLPLQTRGEPPFIAGAPVTGKLRPRTPASSTQTRLRERQRSCSAMLRRGPRRDMLTWTPTRCAAPLTELAVTLPRPRATPKGTATLRLMLCRFSTAKGQTEPARGRLARPPNHRGGGAMENTRPRAHRPSAAPNGHSPQRRMRRSSAGLPN